MFCFIIFAKTEDSFSVFNSLISGSPIVLRIKDRVLDSASRAINKNTISDMTLAICPNYLYEQIKHLYTPGDVLQKIVVLAQNPQRGFQDIKFDLSK